VGHLLGAPVYEVTPTRGQVKSNSELDLFTQLAVTAASVEMRLQTTDNANDFWIILSVATVTAPWAPEPFVAMMNDNWTTLNDETTLI
jgi:hypothetical protein